MCPTRFVYAAHDPAESAQRLAAFTERPASSHGPGEVVALNRGWLAFYRPGDLADLFGVKGFQTPAVARIGLTSRDLAQTRDFLIGKGVGLLRDEPERLVVAPQDAAACALIVEPTA